MIGVSVNTSVVLANLKHFARKLEGATDDSLLDVGHEIMRLSQLEVPEDTSYLANTGTVRPSGKSVVVGYHAPYAARLHEHPEYNFQNGKKGRYLEDPIRNNEKVLGVKMGNNMKKKLK